MLTCPNNCITASEEDQRMSFCAFCGEKLVIRTRRPLRKTLYLHSDNEGNYTEAKEWGFSEAACREFSRAGYEVGLVIEVDPTTGEAHMIGVESLEEGKTVVVSLAKAVMI